MNNVMFEYYLHYMVILYKVLTRRFISPFSCLGLENILLHVLVGKHVRAAPPVTGPPQKAILIGTEAPSLVNFVFIGRLEQLAVAF